MRQWIDLFEARSAPLYHFTTFANARSIIEDGEFRSRGMGFICTTRDPYLKFYRTAARFDLDRNKIAHRYSITPHSFMHRGRREGESEERIAAGRLPTTYVTAMTLMPINGRGAAITAVEWRVADELAAFAAKAGLVVKDLRGPRPESPDQDA
jgi:hypothetical protein